MSIGIDERNTPNTGINPDINTMIVRVKISGNDHPPWKKLMTMSPIVVRMAFTSAMID
jgi:hypothetical protein